VFGLTAVIQAPKLGLRIMRYELADYEWTVIKPMLPNKPRGVPRVNDGRDQRYGCALTSPRPSTVTPEADIP
jgi:transposase